MFPRENKKRNFDETERLVQNSVYTVIIILFCFCFDSEVSEYRSTGRVDVVEIELQIPELLRNLELSFHWMEDVVTWKFLAELSGQRLHLVCRVGNPDFDMCSPGRLVFSQFELQQIGGSLLQIFQRKLAIEKFCSVSAGNFDGVPQFPGGKIFHPDHIGGDSSIFRFRNTTSAPFGA